MNILDAIKSGRRWRVKGESAWRNTFDTTDLVIYGILNSKKIKIYNIPENLIDAEIEIEPDQTDLDREAFEGWVKENCGISSYAIAWHAALRWERERVK
jgi:hypothetical protein